MAENDKFENNKSNNGDNKNHNFNRRNHRRRNRNNRSNNFKENSANPDNKTLTNNSHPGQSTRQSGHLPPKSRHPHRNHDNGENTAVATNTNTSKHKDSSVPASNRANHKPFNNHKPRAEETLKDILAEQRQIEKEIILEIAAITNISLD